MGNGGNKYGPEYRLLLVSNPLCAYTCPRNTRTHCPG